MLRYWGILLIVAGAALNEWTVKRIVFFAGVGMGPRVLWLVRALDVALIAWGVITIAFRQRMLVKKLNLALFSLAVMAPPAAELGLRLSFHFEKSPTRNPELFANYYCDDDYWRLRTLWKAQLVDKNPQRIHRVLGWSQTKVSEQNPWGLRVDTNKLLADGVKNVILFYGDSYVAGAGDEAHQLPAYMGKRMPDFDVVNVGVGGYGSDQSYLLFRETWRLGIRGTRKPAIIMGVLTEDLDRALLTFRTAPKLQLGADSNGRLEPRNSPLPADPNDWLQASPVGIRSYLASIILTALRPREIHPRMEEVKALNRQIIQSVHEITTREGLDLLYVVFYGPGAYRSHDWRERFLKEELDKRSIRYLDTRIPIDAYCARMGVRLEVLYAENGHHNNLGNEVVGDALIEIMNRK